MRILFITAELTPLAKVGGLADVAGALPPALAALGHDVRVLMPRYEQIDPATHHFHETGTPMTVSFDGRDERVRLYEGTVPDTNVPLLLLDHDRYLSSGPVYSGDPYGELLRFLFFSQAAVTALPALDWTPDVIHCHDWHTGLVPGILRARGMTTTTVFTIHNLGYQGKIKPADVARLLPGLPLDQRPWTLTDRDGDLNFIQQAIWQSDAVTTVSPTYAREILTPAYGEGLERDLQQHRNQVRGILNGIDVGRFDPATDRAIAQTYTSETLATAKPVNRAALRTELNLDTAGDPMVIGMVTRLAAQKGFDLTLDVLPSILETGAQFVVLGTGDPVLEQALTAAVQRHTGQVAAVLAFDAALAQRIYAGSDFFLMPSAYEPCGLGQMIALRYGTIPVVRVTGGLADTVPDVSADPSGGLGFAFTEYTPAALLGAVQRAVHLDRGAALDLARRGMGQDMSWTKSAREYATLYASLTS